MNRQQPSNQTARLAPPMAITLTNPELTEEIDLGSYRALAWLGDRDAVRVSVTRIVSTLGARPTCQVVVVADNDLVGETEVRQNGGQITSVLGVDDVHRVLSATTLPTLVVADSPYIDPLIALQTSLGAKRPFTLLSGEMHHRVEVVIAVDEAHNHGTFPRHARMTSIAISIPSPRVPLQDRPGSASAPICVNILGPVAISGTDYPLARHPKLTELVVYLALHGGGASSRNWTTALWPERRVPVQTVANRLSEARRILGFAADGKPRLRRNGERHCLVEVTSDWEQFQRLSEQSASPDEWQAALALVRGRPFDELAQGQWVVFEGFTSEIERRIGDCALELGNHALNTGNPDLATWAIQQALRACPFDERLHRLLMRCADASGNRAGVEATLRHLALILEIDGDPLYGVHPETAELYAKLIGRSQRRPPERQLVPRHG